MNTTCVYLRADRSVLRSEMVPLGIAYIAGSLESAGHKSDMLFINLKSNISKLLSTQKSRQPKIFAISIMGDEEIYLVQNLTPCIKKLFPQALIIAGGSGVTLKPEKFIAEKLGINALCIGEGDTAIKKYVAMAESGNFVKTDNLWLKTDRHNWLKCDKSVFEANVDSLPFPKISAFNKFTIITSNKTMLLNRGCPNRCIYCLSPVFKQLSHGTFVRQRKVESVIEEIKHIKANFPETGRIALNSDNALSDKQYIVNLCNALEEYNNASSEKINFMLRINFLPELLKENNKIISMLKKAGIDYVQFGFESGSAEIRTRLKRPYYTNEQVMEFVRRLKENKIKIEIYAMYCYPFETAESRLKTIECLKAFKANVVRYQCMMPMRDTELASYFKENGISEKISLFKHLKIKLSLLGVYLSYKPVFESMKLILFGNESGGLGIKSYFMSLISKILVKKNALNTEYIRLGKKYFDSGDFEKALKYYNKIQISESKNWIYSDIAMAYMNIGDYERSLVYFDLAVAKADDIQLIDFYTRQKEVCLQKRAEV